MSWWRHRWGRRLQALAVPLLAAVLLHGLLLAAASLRSPRTAATPPLRPDDTPELLVFSRLPPEPLPTSDVPLPPPEVLPAPPPPPLPARPARPARLRGQPQAPAASRASGSRPLSKVRAGRPAIARGPASARRPASRAPQRSPLPTASPKDPIAFPKGPIASPTPTASSTPAEAAAPWRLLWQGAEGGDALPAPPEALAAALAVAPPQTEVRRLPLQRARQQGVDPESGQLLRLDGHRLLLWIEGGDLWLLRTPA